MLVEDLPGGQDILLSRPLPRPRACRCRERAGTGRFRTAPSDKRDVSFVWGGDVAGQVGHQPTIGGDVHLRNHAQAPAGFPAAFPATPSMPTVSFLPR